jgi:biotin carboxyl carrier protein
VLVLKHDREAGTVRLRIGAHCHTVRMEDERSRLVQVLGIDRGARAVVRELKAPMPGLVLKVLVKECDAVKKNDPLLVLEAMKMENVNKSAGDAVLQKVHAVDHAAVEKGQLQLSIE